MHVVTVALDAIEVSDNVRKRLQEDRLEGLADSIADVGMLHPVIVKETGEGKYRLVAGFRRLMAARLLGRDTVSALVLQPDADPRRVQLVENLQREDLDPLERAEAIRLFMQEGRLSKSEAARRLGVPRTTLTDWLDILDVEPRFQHAVVDQALGGDSPLTLSHIAEAKALAQRLGSAYIATLLLDAALEYKLTKAEIREVARMVRENRNVTIRQAVRALREMQAAQAEEDEPAGLGPAEANLVTLMRVLDRSERIVASMQHLTHRFLAPETRERLLEGFRRLEEMARVARERLEMPLEPLPGDKPPKRKKRGKGKAKGPGGVRRLDGHNLAREGRLKASGEGPGI